jgi:hypothetical protein
MTDKLPNGLAAITRKEQQIHALGGTVPAPWPWAIYERGGKRYVDVALRLLQLTETVEALKDIGAAVQQHKKGLSDADVH